MSKHKLEALPFELLSHAKAIGYSDKVRSEFWIHDAILTGNRSWSKIESLLWWGGWNASVRRWDAERMSGSR